MADDQQLFLRKWDVTVANASAGLDLSQLHIIFSIRQSDVETPNNCVVRIYNLSEQTSSKLIAKEYDRVVISAGYESGPYGVIFDGTIKQTRRGRENAIDTYLDILGADADEAYNYGFVSQTVAAGRTPKDQIDTITKAMGVEQGYVPLALVGEPGLTRGKVIYGLGKDQLRNIALSKNARWSLQNGKMILIPNKGYIPAQAIIINSKTGMIGIPEQTQGGIRVRSLLNPKLTIGQSIKINNADVASFLTNPTYLQGAFTTASPENIASVKAADGLYRIVVSEFEGDTRGNDWYSDLTCFAINQAADPNSSVNPWPSTTAP